MEKLRVKVPVANLWRTKDAPREVDQKILQGDAKGWVAGMSDQETIQLCDDDMIDSQLLFNDEVVVENKEDGWIKVIVLNQPTHKNKLGYPGWIPSASLGPAIPEQETAKSQVTIKVKTAILSDAQNKPLAELSLGTDLEKLAEENGKIQVATPLGIGYIDAEAVKVPADLVGANDGETMVNIGKQFLGMRYLWGGISAYGYDCSGLVCGLHRALGIILPRDADDQQVNGDPIDVSEIKPGDLIFFAYEHGTGNVHHVGMYIGNGQMIESRTPGKKVDIAALTEPKFAAEYAGYRRYWH
ncbi:cell wall-associated hydrolase [Ligilactobacillus salitolerans]|uniref:Cell wall-associated hydrolase n=1 Tax=Ligilactobacillus salitolerans TaxID=1808352 RepID=A0A401IS97_9LACO|nr:NlpC/P60 family protein [Ligilactobacillus salitolerans]GBG94375.1 cell wall-associated hydrolase [Ligilactobacillus salitolerans]